MRTTTTHRWGRLWFLLVSVASPALAQESVSPVSPTQTQAPSAVRSDQIDRYEAIRQLQAELKSDPKSEQNWIILGELAHEIAFELAGEQDTPYYKMSRNAYEQSLKLNPSSPALQAAVQFAKDQETAANEFDQTRRQAVPAYLARRRQELTQFGTGPQVRVYAAPTPRQPPTQPSQLPAAATATATAPAYRPYYQGQGRQPYSYQQYSTDTLPSVSSLSAGAPLRQGATNPASTRGCREAGRRRRSPLISDSTGRQRPWIYSPRSKGR